MTTVLITGASAGIGEAFARALATQKYDLVLVARSEDKLSAIAEQLAAQHSIRTHVIAQDLTLPNAASTVAAAVESKGLSVDWLINNAGFGRYGEFTQVDRQTHLQMVQLNVTALVDLTYHFLPAMQQRRSGCILNVSSTAAFQPIPYMSIYAATKAFILSFSEALWVENQDYDIKVLAVCPGPTKSQFVDRANFPDSMAKRMGQNYDSSEEVVRDALKALDRGQSTVVTGSFSNKVVATLPRLLPRQNVVKLVGQMFES
ncbi:MAG: SDR family oxidoreductase [Leptolyngbyaceae cyanobacterium SM1_1_3]|nr:SDR family oxidoreductase [Leptolyngbyaceae cyanobacterium SM1_1_3]NJN03649.1 SDR family oxidoreductase [Leptolyngbyaceae cyanobacterium RM1_1_2]NJO10109.1 SDR family oxidoreductase [Leptolyngbyaceae cyanobacterium SL_1_1]